MHRLFPVLSRLFPMFLVMGVIFFLSGIPGDRLILPKIVNIDKIAHILAYGLLAVTVFHALGPWFQRLSSRSLSTMVILICVFYGISDEYHQSFIPGRSPSFLDILADCLGAIIVSVVRNSRLWKQRSL